jgi:methylated-DNA-[protein]-cysteine S-methyltransferase
MRASETKGSATIHVAELDSPVGVVAVAWRGDTIVGAFMDVAKNRTSWDPKYAKGGSGGALREWLATRFPNVAIEASEPQGPAKALVRYFDGDLRAIDRVAVDPGGTEFQARVWAALREIPPGETRTYSEMAAAAGRPGAARAAGGAVGSNPIPIVIPCHRVVGADRKLTGFGGGLPRKRWLLEHEGANVDPKTHQLNLL